MNILVVQSSVSDPVGVFGEHLTHHGATLSIWVTEKQTAPPKGEYDGLIVLGGSMNAHEDDKFPHLRAAVNLIQEFYRAGKPIIGICLGAQLLARAFGSQVYKHSTPEIGFCAVRTVDEADSEPLLKDIPQELFLMQWHFDTFDLPTEATLLMTNNVCKHQAYRIGENVYGFQFHFEVTPQIVETWLRAKSDWVAENYPYLDAQVESQLQMYGQSSALFAQRIATRWLALFPQKVLT